MRRCFALLALVVTTWSNVGVLPCAPAVAQPSDPEATAGHHQHAGHVVADPRTDDVPGHDSDDRPASHPTGQDCGLVMACGAALGGQSAAADGASPLTFDEIPPAGALAPSTADLTQDPPPPRRLA